MINMGITYYRFIDGLDQNSLEGVAIALKRNRQEIDSLAIAYERAQEHLAAIIDKQKEASEQYKDLKERLVKLAEEESAE